MGNAQSIPIPLLAWQAGPETSTYDFFITSCILFVFLCQCQPPSSAAPQGCPWPSMHCPWPWFLRLFISQCGVQSWLHFLREVCVLTLTIAIHRPKRLRNIDCRRAFPSETVSFMSPTTSTSSCSLHSSCCSLLSTSEPGLLWLAVILIKVLTLVSEPALTDYDRLRAVRGFFQNQSITVTSITIEPFMANMVLHFPEHKYLIAFIAYYLHCTIFM